MKIASWTLAGIAEHADAILGWLREHEPVVACLRGTFVADGDFPLVPLWELGYYTKLFGGADQPGLAILSVEPPRAVHRGLAAGEDVVSPRRALTGRVAGLRLVNIVAPVEEAALAAYVMRVPADEKVLVLGVRDDPAIGSRKAANNPRGGLVDLTADLEGAGHRVLAEPALAAQCTSASVCTDVPAGEPALAFTFEGLPPPEIPSYGAA